MLAEEELLFIADNNISNGACFKVSLLDGASQKNICICTRIMSKQVSSSVNRFQDYMNTLHSPLLSLFIFSCVTVYVTSVFI